MKKSKFKRFFSFGSELGEISRNEKIEGVKIVYHKGTVEGYHRLGGYVDEKRTLHVIDKDFLGRFILAHELAHWGRWNKLTCKFLKFMCYTLGVKVWVLFGVFSFIVALVLKISWFLFGLVGLLFAFFVVQGFEEMMADREASKIIAGVNSDE